MRSPIRMVTLLVLTGLLATACNANRSKFPNWLFVNPPQVSTHTTAGSSDFPAIATDYNGNSAVVWSFNPDAVSGSGDSEIYWRRYNALGQPTTDPIRLTLNGFGDYSPSITFDALQGLWYVVWMGDEITSSNIYWAAIDSNGTLQAGPQAISSATYNDYNPKVYGCLGYAYVLWEGNTAANDYDIHFSKVRYNGIVDIPDVSVAPSIKPEDHAQGLLSADCTKLFVINERTFTFSPLDTDVRFAIIDTSDGSTPTSFYPANTTDNEDHPSLNAIGLTGSFSVSLMWHHANTNATHSVYYASYTSTGTACTPPTALQTTLATDAKGTPDGSIITNDYPHVVGLPSGSSYYVAAIWRHYDVDTNQIYGTIFADNCAAPSGLSYQLISTNNLRAGESNEYSAIAAKYAPDSIPVFAAVWRTSSGRTYSRFGSVNGMIPGSDAEYIADTNSGSLPPIAPDTSKAPELAAINEPLLSIGNQLHVAWVGGTIGQIWYQQTAWKVDFPAASYNTP